MNRPIFPKPARTLCLTLAACLSVSPFAPVAAAAAAPPATRAGSAAAPAASRSIIAATSADQPSLQIVPPPPSIPARSDILIDATTGQVLTEHDDHERLPMASLTKLMTAFIVFHALQNGTLTLDQPVLISKHAWQTGGSRTFVKVGSKVPVRDLIKGMLVQSGNDATVALAEQVGGSEPAFVQMMNQYAQRLGLHDTHYVDATGLPRPMHYTTARDLATLTEALIHQFPQYYHWFKLRQFTWNHITQQNRNGLLWTDPSVDGLKTGYTDAAGYCMITSAKRGDTRLISVVLGAPSEPDRLSDSETLLNYGFSNYQTVDVKPGGTPVLDPRVYEGARQYVPVGPDANIVVTVPRAQAASIQTRANVKEPLIAPLTTRTPVGRFSVSAGGRLLASIPVYPLKAVAEGGWWTRLTDSVRLLLQRR